MFRVEVIRPLGYLHVRCLEDHATSIELSLRELHRYDDEGRDIVFGAHLLTPKMIGLMPTDIIYNMEAHSSQWMTTAYIDLLKAHDVLDYSLENVKWLRDRGVRAWHLPIEYHLHLTRVDLLPDEKRTVDVLFYGSMTPRRLPILKAIQDAGFHCRWLSHEQWTERDYWLVSSKIVLNLHAYEGAPFEMARVSYLLANKAFVISEGPAETEYRDVVMFQAPNNIALACKFWLNDPGMRATIAQRGFDQFSAKPQRDSLRRVLREMGAM